MTNRDTIYRFNAEAFIEENDLDKTFYEKVTSTNDKGKEEVSWEPVTVGTVWITDGPKEYQIHIPVSGENDHILVLPITKKQYDQFKADNGEKRRLNLVAKLSKGKLRFRKIRKSEMLVIRMSKKRINKLIEDAALCNLSTSAYARKILEGYRPRKALSEQEAADIRELVKMRADMINFYSATKGVLKNIPREKRAEFIVLGNAYQQFRVYIQKVLKKFDQIINREKEV